MDAGDWVALGAAGVSLIGAGLAYLGAKRGAAATLQAARESAQASQINTLLETAKALRDSDRPEDKAQAYALVRATARLMGRMPNAPDLLIAVTRIAELDVALDEARRLEQESGQPPQVVIEDQEES